MKPPRWPVRAAVVVVLAAIAATAHGLFETVLWAGVPAGVGWLYPVLTDGLALVAYAATTRLRGWALAYSWGVLVLGAGLSGLGQAIYLAGVGVEQGVAPVELRFGVGAWPAVAAAIAAHLLHLLGRTAPDKAEAPPERRGLTPDHRSERGDAPSIAAPQPAEPTPAPRQNVSGEAALVTLTRELLPIGRRQLARELGVSEHVARQLLEQAKTEQPRNGHKVLEGAK